MSTPTPRTDAEEYPEGEGKSFQVVSADFARKLERELTVERQKLRTARAALASIEEQWWANNDTNMHACGNVMFTLAKNAHAATEDKT
jgi:hypothetical protein